MYKLKKLSVLALKLNSKIVSAESCTAGLLSASLTEISGSSAFFEQGYITYSNHSKTSVLGVENKTLKKYTLKLSKNQQIIHLNPFKHPPIIKKPSSKL